MVFLILERLSQLWIADRFGCTEELIKTFKMIEKQDLFYKNQAKDKVKKQTEKRLSMKRGRTGQIRGQSFVSAATSSNAGSSDEDSFQTDPDMRSKAHQSLRSI